MWLWIPVSTGCWHCTINGHHKKAKESEDANKRWTSGWNSRKDGNTEWWVASRLERLRLILVFYFDKSNFCLSSDPPPITTCDSSPLFTCIRRGTKTEEPFTSASSPHQQRQAKDTNEDSEAEDIWQPQLRHYRWSPFECSQPWTPFNHTCHQPAHDSWVCGRTSTLSGATEWDRFEVLIQELEGKQSDPIPTPAPTDLPLGPTSVRWIFPSLSKNASLEYKFNL